MGTAYISRFGHWHRVATADGRISVLELFRDKEWKSQRYILQDEQILPELMNSEHPMVARGARILHLLSLNYSTPYITTPAKIHAVGRQWRLAEQHIEAIFRISEKPESLRNCDIASPREYCSARRQYLDLLKTAIDHYNQYEETDEHIHTAIRRLVQARRLVRLLEPGYFLSQERQKTVLPEQALFRSVNNNALPPGMNIIMWEPRKTKAARRHETLAPQILLGREPWIQESPTPQSPKGRTREATYINIPPTPRYDPLAKTKRQQMGSTSHVLPLDIVAAN